MEPMRIDQVAVPQDRVDEKTGRVRVWSLHTQSYKDVPPVDACEMIARGSCTLDKPEPTPELKPVVESEPEPEPEPVAETKRYTRSTKQATKVTDSD